MDWLTVEVFDAGTPASAWARSWRDSLVETALASGAVFWEEHSHAWGVVLEFTFGDEVARERFRSHPTLTAALDAAPDPMCGVVVYPHRGGGTGVRVPRRPRPNVGAGAVELPAPPAAVDALDPQPRRPRWSWRCRRGSRTGYACSCSNMVPPPGSRS